MRLRNTEWVLGVIVYAGPDSKLARNQKRPPSKFSSLDRRLNRYIDCLKALSYARLYTQKNQSRINTERVLGVIVYATPAIQILLNRCMIFFENIFSHCHKLHTSTFTLTKKHFGKMPIVSLNTMSYLFVTSLAPFFLITFPF